MWRWCNPIMLDYIFATMSLGRALNSLSKLAMMEKCVNYTKLVVAEFVTSPPGRDQKWFLK
jgi:hypothetical protein